MSKSPRLDNSTRPEDPSVDAVYSEWYNEMRRYRDFEHTIASWASTVLLALAAGGVTIFTSEPPKLSQLQSYAFFVAIAAITVISDLIIYYCGRRYRELKEQAKGMEPTWKTELHKVTVSQLPRFFNPLFGQISLVTILGVVACAIVLNIPTR